MKYPLTMGNSYSIDIIPSCQSQRILSTKTVANHPDSVTSLVSFTFAVCFFEMFKDIIDDWVGVDGGVSGEPHVYHIH